MKKIKEIKIINQDESTEIADIGADAVNVDYNDTTVKAKLDELNTTTNFNTGEINSLKTSVSSLSSGSPKGSYTNVNALISDNPDTGVYIITENGHIYSWTKNGTNAIDLGVYQAIEMDENNEQYQNLIHRDLYVINACYTNKLELYKGKFQHAMVNDSGVWSLNTDTNLAASEIFIPLEINETYTLSTNSSVSMNLYFYDNNKNFIESLYPNGSLTPALRTFTNINYSYCRVGVWKSGLTETDWIGVKLQKELNNVTDINTLNRRVRVGQIYGYGKINIDTTNKTISFSGSYNAIYCGKDVYSLNNKTYDISRHIDNGAFVWYDADNDVFSTDTNNINNYIYLGAIWRYANKIDLNISSKDTSLCIDNMPILQTSRNEGLKIACLGDSMTAGTGTTKTYREWLEQLIGTRMSSYNYGISGSCITPKKDSYPTWEENIQSFLERYPNMANDAGIITVFGGVNDWVTGRDLGDINSTDTYTFYGAMKSLCQGLINKYKTKRIYFFTSPQNDYINRPANIPSGNEFYGNVEGKNRKGYKLTDYVKAMEEVCAIYGIPCYNLYNSCWYGLSGVLSDGTYGTDNLHPNYEGHKILAIKMMNFINNN